jgi:hypothetical protein
MAAKLTRMTHKIAIQLHLVAQSCTSCSSCSRRPVRKLLDTPSYVLELSWRLTTMKSPRAISCFRLLYETDVSRTISVIIVRDLICQRSPRYLPRPLSVGSTSTDTSKLGKGTRYMDHLVMETIGIQLRPNSFNGDEEFNLSYIWCPVINVFQRSRGQPMGKERQVEVGAWIRTLVPSHWPPRTTYQIPDDGYWDGPRNAGFIQTPGAADSPEMTSLNDSLEPKPCSKGDELNLRYTLWGNKIKFSVYNFVSAINAHKGQSGI